MEVGGLSAPDDSRSQGRPEKGTANNIIDRLLDDLEILEDDGQNK